MTTRQRQGKGVKRRRANNRDGDKTNTEKKKRKIMATPESQS